MADIVSGCAVARHSKITTLNFHGASLPHRAAVCLKHGPKGAPSPWGKKGGAR